MIDEKDLDSKETLEEVTDLIYSYYMKDIK